MELIRKTHSFYHIYKTVEIRISLQKLLYLLELFLFIFIYFIRIGIGSKVHSQSEVTTSSFKK